MSRPPPKSAPPPASPRTNPSSSAPSPTASNAGGGASSGGATRPPPTPSSPAGAGSAAPPPPAAGGAGAGGGAASSRHLSTIKVRNVQSSLMYHLMFDGDIGALTGAQLRQHIEGVSSIPASKQILSLNGRSIGSMVTGADVDLRNGSTLMLEVAGGGRAGSPQTGVASQQQPPSAAAGGIDDQTPYRSPVGMNRSSGAGRPRPAAHPADEMPPLPPHSRHDVSSTHHHHSSAAAHPDDQLYGGGHHGLDSMVPSRRYADADDVDVVVDIIEESDAPAEMPEVGPGFVSGDAVAVSQFRRTAADVEEMRLQQQEYVWKLEQVRFETERLNREREMKRQLMELEYEATLLDRDRVELERHTAMEKQKLGSVAAQNRLELDILQKFFPGSQM